MRILFSSVLLVKASEREDARAGVVAEADRGGYRLVDLAELRTRYEKDPESVLLVDTREEGEFRAGHIRNARLFSMMPTWWATVLLWNWLGCRVRVPERKNRPPRWTVEAHVVEEDVR